MRWLEKNTITKKPVQLLSYVLDFIQKKKKTLTYISVPLISLFVREEAIKKHHKPVFSKVFLIDYTLQAICMSGFEKTVAMPAEVFIPCPKKVSTKIPFSRSAVLVKKAFVILSPFVGHLSPCVSVVGFAFAPFFLADTSALHDTCSGDHSKILTCEFLLLTSKACFLLCRLRRRPFQSHAEWYCHQRRETRGRRSLHLSCTRL